jgi:CRISPR-associated protein Cas5h
MKRLISFDIKADFGFLRKPDTNEGLSMTYNMLHKPALMGILGAIVGYEGYQQKGVLPEYYQKFQNLKVAIKPLNAQNGNFSKTTIVYTNTVGYANKDGNFIAYENTLIKPSYRVYLLIDDGEELYSYLHNYEACFLPYLGKNEFPLWWENTQTHFVVPFDFREDYTISSLILKKESVSDKGAEIATDFFSLDYNKVAMLYFERLPIGFSEFKTKKGIEYQYQLKSFAYTDIRFNKDYKLDELYETEHDGIIQLF